jgi:hypothetical protein
MPLQVKDTSGATKTLKTPTGTIYHFGGTAFAAVATPTAWLVIKANPTAGGKTVYVHRVRVQGAATAAGTMPVVITKRTTDGTVGSAALTAITAAKQSSADSANVGVVATVGTANYSVLGSAAGIMGAGRIEMCALATGVAAVPYEWVALKPIALLPGTTEEVTVECSGAAIPSGGVIDWEVVTEEE